MNQIDLALYVGNIGTMHALFTSQLAEAEPCARRTHAMLRARVDEVASRTA